MNRPFPKNLLRRRLLGMTGALLLLAVPTAFAQTAERGTRASIEEATAIAERLSAQRVDPMTVAIQRAESAHLALTRTARDTPEESKAAAQFISRVAALRAFPRPEALDLIATALTRPEAEARLAGLLVLREGAGVGNERSTALLLARELIQSDPDPVVRRQAFEAYSRWGNQDDVLTLSQQLGRARGPVQDLAVREWLRIERERL